MKALHFAVGHRTKGTKQGPAAAHARYILRVDADAGEHAAYVTRSRAHVREDLIATGTGNLPGWAEGNPVRFFEQSDRWERGGIERGGRAATQITASLPRDLSHAQHQEAVELFLQGQLGTRHAYVWGIHETVAKDGGRYPHVHIAFSERTDAGHDLLPSEYFSQKGYHKDRTFSVQGWPKVARQAWADSLNVTLEQAGVSMRVDARSFRAQGFDQDGMPYLSRHEVRRHPELLAAREARADTPAMQAKRAAAWEERKQTLGLTPDMDRAEIAQRIGAASRQQLHTLQAERQAHRQALEGKTVAHVERQLTLVEARHEEAVRVAHDEAQYRQHPERVRSMEHLVAVGRVLRSAEEDTPQRRLKRRMGRDDEDERTQRQGQGYLP